MPCATGNCPLSSEESSKFPPCPFITGECWNTTVNVTSQCLDAANYSVSALGNFTNGSFTLGSHLIAKIRPTNNCGEESCLPINTCGGSCQSSSNAGSFQSPCPSVSLDVTLGIMPLPGKGNATTQLFTFSGPTTMTPCNFTTSNFWVPLPDANFAGPTITGSLFKTVNQCNRTSCLNLLLDGTSDS